GEVMWRDKDGKQITWDLATGRPTPAAGKQTFPSSSPRSPDGRLFALATGAVIRIHRLPHGKAQGQATGRWWIDPDYRWHADVAQQAWQAGDWFAAAFHLARQLPERPWDAGLHARHAYALARLGRTTEAAPGYLQAHLLEPGASKC